MLSCDRNNSFRDTAIADEYLCLGLRPNLVDGLAPFTYNNTDLAPGDNHAQGHVRRGLHSFAHGAVEGKERLEIVDKELLDQV